MKLKLLLSLLCVSAFAVVHAADGRISISEPTAITAPGSYVLVNDIVSNYSFGIQIRSSDVKLDLNGFTIRQSSGASLYADGIEILPDIKNIEVTNGAITGFARTGVFAPGFTTVGRNLRLSGLRVSDNNHAGISLESNPGFIIQDCVITGNRLGIFVAAAGLIHDNVIGGNASRGLAGFAAEVGYRSNVFYANGTDVAGTPTNLGSNLCSGASCP